MNYHDLFVQVPSIKRARLSSLSYGLEVTCTRTAGWQLWQRTGTKAADAILLGGEYDGAKWLVLDVAGHVIVDSRPKTGA